MSSFGQTFSSPRSSLVVGLPLVLLGSSLARAAEVDITAPEAVVHTAPFNVAPVLARVHAGDKLTGDADAQAGWLRVQLPDSRRGFLQVADARLGLDLPTAAPPAVGSASSPPAPPNAVAGAERGEMRRVGLAIHPEIGFLLPSPSGGAVKANSTPAIASVGLGVGYDIRRRVEVEGTISTTASSTRATKGASGAVDVGTIVRALVRWHQHETGWSPLVSAGPAVITGGNFGTVPLLHVEGGIELRSQVGFYFATAMQLVEPLVTSRPDIDPAQCVTSDCPSRFNPHDPIIGVRMTAGFRF